MHPFTVWLSLLPLCHWASAGNFKSSPGTFSSSNPFLPADLATHPCSLTAGDSSVTCPLTTGYSNFVGLALHCPLQGHDLHCSYLAIHYIQQNHSSLFSLLSSFIFLGSVVVFQMHRTNRPMHIRYEKVKTTFFFSKKASLQWSYVFKTSPDSCQRKKNSLIIFISHIILSHALKPESQGLWRISHISSFK